MANQTDEEDLIPIEIAQEYAAKILGFAPLQLSDDIYNIVNDNLGSMLDKFGEHLLDKYNTKLSSNKLDQLLFGLKYKLEAQQNHFFDTFDTYLIGDILYVDPDVVVEEDQVQLKYSEKRDQSMDECIESNTKRIQVLQHCLAGIEKEQDQISSYLDIIGKLHERTNEILKARYSCSSVNDLCATIRDRNSFIQRICELLNNDGPNTDSRSSI